MSTSPRRISTASRPRRALGLALLLCLTLCAAALPALADEPIRVVASQNSFKFSESLTFTLKVESDSPLSDVILFFGRVKGPLVRRVYPEFGTGSPVTITYTEELERGQFAPGTVLRVWWELHDQAGHVLKTPETTLTYDDDTQDWQVLSGKRVDLYWYGNQQSEAQSFLDSAEAALTRLETDIGVAVEPRVRVYVYNSDSDMSKAVAVRSTGYDEATVTLGMTVDDDTMLLLGSDSEADATLAHELSHIVVGIATDNPYSGLPRWLDEGLAMYAQGRLDARNSRALESAVKSDTLLSIRSMSSYSGQASEVDLFYGEAYSVVDFVLKEFGRDKMRALLAVFAQGTDQESALRQVLNVGLDQLDAMWRTSLGLAPRKTATPATGAEQRAQPASVATGRTGTASSRTAANGRVAGSHNWALLQPLSGLAPVRGWPGAGR